MMAINAKTAYFFIVKENHSFDNYFGRFPGANGDNTLAHATDPPKVDCHTITGPGSAELQDCFDFGQAPGAPPNSRFKPVPSKSKPAKKLTRSRGRD